MIDRRDIIEDSCDSDEWNSFSDKIEMLDDKELIALADRLNVSVKSNAEWRDYRDAFGKEYWRDFTMAYEHVMGGTY